MSLTTDPPTTEHGTMMADDDLRTALAVISARLDDIKQDVADIRADQQSGSTKYTSRGEWEQRNNNVDNRFLAMGREIGDLRTELNSKRAPWWSVVAVIISGAAILWTVFEPVLTR